MAVNAIVLHDADNVAVATVAIKPGEALTGIKDHEVTARDEIPQWHKIALRGIAEGQPVIKYGECIGIASAAIYPGQHVHTHNLKPEGD
jgi:hypothetical protein